MDFDPSRGPPAAKTTPCGLFIGRATLDLISVLDAFPQANEKVAAREQIIAGGGPALNAAITFSHFGGRAVLASTFGAGVFATYASQECRRHGVEVIDRAANQTHDFPVSCILSSVETSARCVVNPPALVQAASFPAPATLPTGEQPPALVCLDQFEADAVQSLAPFLKALNVPIILDGGSWRAATPLFLDLATLPIVSASFAPPGGRGPDDAAAFLSARGYERWAITCGADGVVYSDRGARGRLAAIPVHAIDTLGAGDIFHGAFCAALASGRAFVPALDFANRVAAESCRYAGTRAWMARPLTLD